MKGSVFLAALVFVGAAAVVQTGTAGPSAPSTQASFSGDPRWEGVNNRQRARCVTREFDFGWVTPTTLRPTGAIGGQVERSTAYHAYYAQTLPTTKSLDDPLSASGTLWFQGAKGGFLFGWFNSVHSVDWRTPEFLGIRVDGGHKTAQAYAEYGTINEFSGTTAATTVPTITRVPWTLQYVPDGGTSGVGLLRVTFGAVTSEVSIDPLKRADRAIFDRFGLMNVQVDGGRSPVYVDTLTVDGVPVDLTSDPGWDGVNNTLTAEDCMVHNNHSFGYSPATSFAGGAPGEIGGLVWRGRRAWYAAPIADVTLDDTLYAEGRLDVESASVDADVFVGWFNRGSKLAGDYPANIVAADLGGPSDWGLRLYPIWEAAGTISGTYGPLVKFEQFASAPLVSPRHHPWQWWICYRPIVGDGGRLTVGIADPAGVLPGTHVSIKVKSGARAAHPIFDRFGIRSMEQGGHSTLFYLDDLQYTSGPGDTGPDDRCPLKTSP